MSNVDFGKYSKRLVQMIWDPEPRNDNPSNSPIWCLGRRYESRNNPLGGLPPIDQKAHTRNTGPQFLNRPQLETRLTSSGFEHVEKDELATAVNGSCEEWPADFLSDFESRIWLTYRSNFAPIAKSDDPKAISAMSFSVRLKSQLSQMNGFTSDTGWGCMIRSGQSLLANTLAILRLGHDPHYTSRQAAERQLLSLFADDPRAPFSIHNFVQHGARACGTYPGQWFGPSATAKCIKALCSSRADTELRVYVTGDGPDVFEDELLEVAKGEDGVFRPTLILVGTRLGIDRVTPVYQEALSSSLMLPQSVGIAGGRPSSSHYFIGTQGTSFFYLDPHITRPALPFHSDPAQYTREEIESCHTRRLRRLSVEDMDPSMLIAFLIRDEEDWRAWRRSVIDASGKHIIHIADSKPLGCSGVEREGALSEVEPLDDDDDDTCLAGVNA